MTDEQLSRRERQIMDAVFSQGEASANQVLEAITDPPSRTAVRTFLRILVDKGHLTQRALGRELFYKPTKQRRRVRNRPSTSVSRLFRSWRSDPDSGRS